MTSIIRTAVSPVCALLLVAAAAPESDAQDLASSLNQLRVLVTVGDTVAVTDEMGLETRGSIATLSSASLELDVDGARRAFAESSIRSIRQRRPDPLKNGALWGLGVGGGLGLLGCFGVAAASDEYGFVPGCVAAYGGLGAAIGVGVDAMISGTHVIFSRPAGVSSRLGVSTIVTPTHQGVLVSFRF